MTAWRPWKRLPKRRRTLKASSAHPRVPPVALISRRRSSQRFRSGTPPRHLSANVSANARRPRRAHLRPNTPLHRIRRRRRSAPVGTKRRRWWCPQRLRRHPPLSQFRGTEDAREALLRLRSTRSSRSTPWRTPASRSHSTKSYVGDATGTRWVRGSARNVATYVYWLT